MYHIVIQYAANKRLAPKAADIRCWAEKALHNHIAAAEVTIRIVNIDEMTQLNRQFRHKNGPTNVLSFPAPADIKAEAGMLGDIVICADVVNREAEEQHKKPEAHWAHMTIHGIFHLLGHDHEKDEEAEVMEALEIAVMRSLGFSDPYATGDNRINHE